MISKKGSPRLLWKMCGLIILLECGPSTIYLNISKSERFNILKIFSSIIWFGLSHPNT